MKKEKKEKSSNNTINITSPQNHSVRGRPDPSLERRGIKDERSFGVEGEAKSDGLTASSNTIYCSLDIETSGFDPLKDEILEVGFVKFQVSTPPGVGSSSKFQVLEEWTQVFKPQGVVDAKIFGLTGINAKELENAPTFEAFKSIIQDKINNTVIVGHNVVFDIKFLESRGIKFSGLVVDTLDLVQWLLPTHHSYNLENLMHYFGVKHPNAHRALADAKATLDVLTSLRKKWEELPAVLHKQIHLMANNFKMPWVELLPVLEKKLQEKPAKPVRIKKEQPEDWHFKGVLQNRTVYNLPLTIRPLPGLAYVLKGQKDQSLLVLPKKQDVLKLWSDYGIKPYFSSDLLFDATKFEAFLKKVFTQEEAKFAFKILVWKATNWQTETITDLNLSFFGGQFKEFIVSPHENKIFKVKVLATDVQTLLTEEKISIFNKRTLVVAGLAEFENCLTQSQSEKVTWGQINYFLKSVFNPELQIGNIELQPAVESGLVASDLFFGLVNAMLQTPEPSYLDIALTEEFKLGNIYLKIQDAAQSFITKLNSINEQLQISGLKRAAENLQNFFNTEPNRVKWLELAPNRCSFNNASLHVKNQAQNFVNNFKKSVFVDNLAPKATLDFFIDRLGLESWNLEKLKLNLPKRKLDLFSNSIRLQCKAEAKNPLQQELLELVGEENLPAAILFGLPKQLKEFYETNYEKLKSFSSLLSQIGSGGSNKLLHNFGINKKSLLLITDRSLLRSFSANLDGFRPNGLAVKTLVVLRLPFDAVNHPYTQALAATYPNAFENMALPKALYNFHRLVQFFYGPTLQNLYLFDTKLNKEYAKAFKAYFEEIEQ